MIHKKHFSLTEAIEELKQILPELRIITELKKSLDKKGFDVYRHKYFGGIGTNGTGKHPPEMEELVNLAREISKKGILIKSLDEGLVDFPHIRSNGDEVYLCFRLGEDSINYWHGLNEGFAGRKSIEIL